MLLGATAKPMRDTVNLVETVSYVLIVLLGARLLWVKGYGFFGALMRVEDRNASGARHAVRTPRTMRTAVTPMT